MPTSFAILPDGEGGHSPYPDLMTEEELVEYLRIRSISGAKDPHNVIEHLKRCRGLPRIHICNGVLYPRKAIQDWIDKETKWGN